jgi:hypothetical protein
MVRRVLARLRAWFVKVFGMNSDNRFKQDGTATLFNRGFIYRKPTPKKPEPVPLPPLSEDEIDQVLRTSRKQLRREKRARR